MSTDTQERRWRINIVLRKEPDPNNFEDCVRLGIFMDDERCALAQTVHALQLRTSGLSRSDIATELMNLAARVEAGA